MEFDVNKIRERSPALLRRGTAYFIDLGVIYFLVIATVFSSVVAYSIWKFGGDPVLLQALITSESTNTFTFVAHACIYFSYFTLAHWYFGSTVGKWVMKLKVVHHKHDLTLMQSLGRTLAYTISGQLSLGIGCMLPLFRKDGRTLHDILLNTDVVKTKPTFAAETAPESSVDTTAA